MSLIDSQVPLYERPIQKPPPGIQSNFINPPTLEPVMVTISIVMTTWMLLFAIIRLYANFRSPRGLAIDDCKMYIPRLRSFGHLMSLDFCITAIIFSISHTGTLLSSK